ncbi:MAG: hypothetical protein E4H01_12140 [Lysobacterales bacterium]|nr:MAG: hypothetical protein E4H01_12140 [Xanthomonadales bacterium]
MLAFAFFTSLFYAVLGRRFGQQRPAVAMSAALGLALSAGLVWWEYANDYSVRDLGALAAGFAVIVLAGVMYQAIKQVGGSWAGAGIALGASLMVGSLLGLNWQPEIMQALITVALVVGILAFLLRHHGHMKLPAMAGAELPRIKHDMADVTQDRRASGWLDRRFKEMRHKAKNLDERPQDAADVLRQLKQMLPAEGWLTERLAQLRQKTHQVSRGQVARIEEIQKDSRKSPTAVKKKASEELIARYGELKLEHRLERLDSAAAENEHRIRDLNRRAQVATQQYDHRTLVQLLDEASKLQHHNSRLFKIIKQSEKRLALLARQVAKDHTGVDRA